MATARPLRSVLYIPGSKPRALDKARGLPVDAIIFDLEDAVSIDSKSYARELLASALADGGYGHRLRIVRINGFDTPWGDADLDALAAVGPDAILLPKVDAITDLEELARRLDAIPAAQDTATWAMMETPIGILNAQSIANGPRLAGFVLGTNDLAKDLGARFRPDRLPMMSSLQHTLLAARAAGIVCVFVSSRAILSPTSLWQFFVATASMAFGFRLLSTGQ